MKSRSEDVLIIVELIDVAILAKVTLESLMPTNSVREAIEAIDAVLEKILLRSESIAP